MRDRSRGAIRILLAAALWSTQGWLIKAIPWSPISILGLRAICVSLFVCICRRSFAVVNNHGTWLAALSVSVTSVLYVAANKLTTAANAVVLQYAMPLFVIAIDWLRDGKRPGLWDIITVLVIAAGIALCFANNLSGGRLIGNILALLSAGTYSVMFYISQNQKVDSLQFIYQGLLISSLGVLYIPFDPGFYITVRIVGRFTLAAAVLFGGYMFFSSGMRMGVSAIHAAILSNVEPIFSPVFAWMMIGEKPGALTVVGVVVVLVTVMAYNIMNSAQCHELKQ
ncbi:MAG: EamA family transporter [Clostridiales bacterium]|nr:EamA family transporter [Clostridiales bacterium]